MLSSELCFEAAGLTVFMTHIGGYPGRYAPGIAHKLLLNRAGLFISGHSHILKVLYDRQLNLLHINPGAAGRQGFQTVRTLVKFDINAGKVENLEVLEIKLSAPTAEG